MDTYKKYDCDLGSLKSTLEENGVAVIPNILSSERCSELRDRAWSDFHRLIGLSREDPSTYSKIFRLYPGHSMMIPFFSIGHLQWVWEIRQDPAIAGAFGLVWDVPPEDLLVSFDGISFHMPPEVTGKGWFEEDYWVHSDQSNLREDFECVQGFVNLYPVDEGDASLYILEGSHKYHQEYFEEMNTRSHGDWHQLPREENYEFFRRKGCTGHRVLASEGSLVLWDSRTFHMGSEPLRERPKQNFRLISYVCMLPRASAEDGVLQDKQKAFQDLRMTNHWANEVTLFPFSPGKNKAGIKKTDIGQPELTPLGRRLAGFD